MKWMALLLAVVFPGGCASTDSPAAGSPGPHGTEHCYIALHGRRIHSLEAGSGPAVILVPGAFSTCRTWDLLAPRLAHGRRTIAVDYLGVGDSDKPEGAFGYTVEEQADVLAEMIVARNLEKVRLVGVSYGSCIVWNLACRHPGLVESVVCIEGGALILPEILQYGTHGHIYEGALLGGMTIRLARSGMLDRLVAKAAMDGAWQDLSDDDRDEITAIVGNSNRTATRHSWRDIHRVISGTIDFTDLAARCTVPVLYIYGEASRYRAMAEVNARFVAGLSPPSAAISFEEGIHDLQLQYPEQVAGAIRKFWGAPEDADGSISSSGFK